MATSRDFEFLYKIKAIADINDVRTGVDSIRKIFNDLQVNPKLKTAFKDIFTDLSNQVDKVEKQINNGIFDQKGLNSFKTGLSSVVGLFNQLYANSKNIKLEDFASSFTADPAVIQPFLQKIEEARIAQQELAAGALNGSSELATAYDTAKKAAQAIYDEHGKLLEQTKRLGSSWKNFADEVKAGHFDEARKQLGYLKKSLELNANTANDSTKYYTAIETAFNNLVSSYKSYDSAIAENTQKVQAAAEPAEGYTKTLELLLNVIRQYPELLNEFGTSIENSSKGAINASRNIESLISRFEYFFSLTNAFRLLRRTITSAFNTVKELDAAMTETATVTEYSVGQMWDKLDEYTAIANRLGATTLGTYKTITLFFQQGLNEAQALSLATETMKMARVAGIDYAEATQYMTSALRGFNMELNESSATRVNDVYSELAKITAADTNQIAIAMSKVASLANSANMELETTSAILSQIIETTQEAPETAGTALKTIIARFAEVKKLYSQGELTGEDEGGEEIDVNKVSVALRKAGINLNDFITGNKGLDEIFLELSQKWNSLDLVTQRYIATMAAGSRQQSRFIAMMQDYDRLIELTNAAYNSAGSGQEQFEKTLDSLEAKLNELKNAWDSFTMSIANSDVLKAAVDGLKILLSVVNKVSDAFGKASGMVKLLFAAGFAKIAGTFTTPIFQSMRDAARSGADFNGILAAGSEGAGKGVSKIGQLFRRSSQPLPEYAPDGRKIYRASQDATNGIDKSAQATSELGDQAKIASTKLIALGAVMSAAGQGAYVLSEKLKKSNPEWSAFLKSSGDALSTMGSLVMVVGSLGRMIPQLGAAISNLKAGPMIGWGLAIYAIIAAFQLLRVEYSKTQQATEDFYDSTVKLNGQISEVYTITSNMSDAYEALSNCKKGTLEWYVQLGKLKELYEQLLALNPDLKDFVTFDENTGYFHFDKEGFTNWSKSQKEFTDKTDRYAQIRESSSYYTTADSDIPGAERGTYTISKDDFTKLYGDLTPEDYIEILNATNTEANKVSNVYSRKELIAKMKGIFGKEDPLWGKMLTSDLQQLYLDMYLDWLAQNRRDQVGLTEEEVKERLRDKTGQNMYDLHGGTDELTENLDLKLSENESATALQGYWSTLQELPDSLRENSDALKALALETADALKNYEELNKVLKDNKDILESNAKDTEAYGVAVGRVWAAAKKAVGDGISYDFVKDNVEDFIDAFEEGSEEALFKIQEKLIETFDINEFLKDKGIDEEGNVIPITLDESQISQIRDTLAELTQDREFRLNGTGDFTALWDLLTATYGLSKEVANAIIQQFMIEGVFVDDGNGNFHYNVSNAGLQNVRNLKAGGSGKKGGGGSKQKEKAWENPYDQLYNLTEANEEAIRKRNLLEKQYNAILRDRESTVNALVLHSLEELSNLQQQLAYQRQLQAGRQSQLNAVNSETWTDSEGNRKSYAGWGVTQYASYNQDTKAIEIDWDAINKVTDQTKGKAIEDYIKRLEELQKEFEQVDSDILDIEAEVDEINRRSMDEYLDLEQRVYDAIVKQHQEVIDSYSSFNDTLNETNDKIMEGLREQIDLERQIRDNTKTEEDIAQKEARLAYLQRDTSGANATETLRLQKEIDDARQAYSDSLIDQQIDSIEKGNEKAAEQRQIQIKTMQEQLNYWTTNGAFWNETYALIQSAFDKDGKFKPNSQLVELLQDTEEFGSLSKFGQTDWYDDLAEAFMKAQEGFAEWKMDEARKKGEITQDDNTYTYDKDKKAWMLDGEAYSAIYDPVSGKYVFTRTKSGDVKTGEIGMPQDEVKASTSNNGSNPSGSKKSGGEELDWNSNLSDGKRKYKVSIGNWYQFVEAADEQAARNKASSYYDTYGIWYAKQRGNNYTLEQFKNQFTKDQFKNALTITRQYASGGFADFTGPAWLDGSKSKPEAVLSAKQTELFISLRDMLEKFGQTGGFNNAIGNTYVDLDVNADIGSDYDVDSLVARLKRDILDSSSYRNVNMLSRGH